MTAAPTVDGLRQGARSQGHAEPVGAGERGRRAEGVLDEVTSASEAEKGESHGSTAGTGRTDGRRRTRSSCRLEGSARGRGSRASRDQGSEGAGRRKARCGVTGPWTVWHPGERKRRRAASRGRDRGAGGAFRGRSGQCGRGHLEKGRSGLTGSRNPRNVLPRAQEIGTADRPMVERLELVLTWGGRFSEEDRGADHTAAI